MESIVVRNLLGSNWRGYCYMVHHLLLGLQSYLLSHISCSVVNPEDVYLGHQLMLGIWHCILAQFSGNPEGGLSGRLWFEFQLGRLCFGVLLVYRSAKSCSLFWVRRGWVQVLPGLNVVVRMRFVYLGACFLSIKLRRNYRHYNVFC